MGKIETILKLNTKNLLRFYRAERKRFYHSRGGYCCDCCGEFIWDLYPSTNPQLKQHYEEQVEFLNLIKAELDTREHINII
jgi:hypothetical protein